MSEAERKEIQRWQERIEGGEQYREENGGDMWHTYRQAFNNRFEEELVGDSMVNVQPGKKITYNLVFSNEKSLGHGVRINRPRVYLYPRRDPGAFLHVKALEAVDNMLIELMDLGREHRLMLKDTYLYGRGFMKVGMHREYAPAGLNIPEGGPRTEYNVNIRQGLPWCVRVPSQHVYVPWGSARFGNLRAIFHKLVRSVDDVHDEPAYIEAVRKKVKANLIAQSLGGGYRVNEEAPWLSDKDVNTELVETWELHDLKEGAVKVMSFDEDRWLLDFPHGTLWNPFVSLAWNEDALCFWPQSDVGQFWYQQLEMNSLRHTMRRLRRMALVRFLVEKGTFDENQLSDLTDEQMLDMVLTVEGSPKDVITLMQMVDIPQGMFAYGELIRQDVREITGQGRNQMGEYDASSRRTAMEAGIVASGSMGRIGEKRGDGIKTFEQAIRKMNWLIARYWTEMEAVAAGGGTDDALRFLLYFRGSDLRDIDYGISTEMVSDEPDTPTEREQKAMGMLPVLGPQATQYLMSLLPNMASGMGGGGAGSVMLGPVGSKPMVMGGGGGLLNAPA